VHPLLKWRILNLFFSKKLHTFRTKLLPRHPPVFHEWFLTTFPDPSAWYNAKLAYARSVAVMSMVGYAFAVDCVADT